MNIVETDRLVKRYGHFEALAGLNLGVPAGCIYGFLGPNGAGKSTTLRILVGLLRPTGGQVRVFGKDAWQFARANCREIGYLPGDVRFPDWMTGEAYLAFCSRARGSVQAHEKVRLCKRFKLDVSRRIRDYSRGMKQKLGLIQAFMHQPRLLILDEPATSLDPLMQQTLYEEVRGAAAHGRSVLFSSHTLSEVEHLCDRVGIIRAGLLMEDSTIDALRTRALRQVTFRIDRSKQTDAMTPEGLAVRESMNGQVTATWQGSVDRLVSWLARQPIDDVTIGPPSLEDLFAAYYAEVEDGSGGDES